MMTPKWAFQPTSGAGAERVGGRFNRVGVPALYLALDATTAINEYRQDATGLPPGTLVSYRIELTSIVDFSNGFDRSWDALWEDWSCDWKKLVLNDIEPPTWVLSDEVLATGAKGLLFPSTKAEGINLVIYVDRLTSEDHIEVYDPRGDLPANQAAWKPLDL